MSFKSSTRIGEFRKQRSVAHNVARGQWGREAHAVQLDKDQSLFRRFTDSEIAENHSKARDTGNLRVALFASKDPRVHPPSGLSLQGRQAANLGIPSPVLTAKEKAIGQLGRGDGWSDSASEGRYLSKLGFSAG